jgi:hypothetical protein
MRAPSLVFLWGVWIETTVLTIFNGGIYSIALVLHLTLPISAATVLGNAAPWHGRRVACQNPALSLEQQSHHLAWCIEKSALTRLTSSPASRHCRVCRHRESET